MNATERDDIERRLEPLHGPSWGWALRCCDGDRDEAQEVLQTAYLKAIDGRARFNGRSTFQTWFFGVVKRTAAEQRRYRLVRRAALVRWWRSRPALEAVPSADGYRECAEARKKLEASLAKLSRRQRDLLHLVFYQELTVEDAATVLGIPVGTARKHYARGKARLRTLLAGAGETSWTGQSFATER